jgi:hypothetical protein
MRRTSICALAIALISIATAADYTRDGGTADWMCCADKACASVISQHADPVRAEKACSALTDADGKTRWTRSNAFRITTTAQAKSVALSWSAPTQNTDGSPLTDLAAYRIRYGTAASALSQTQQIAAPATSVTIANLSSGTWYFSVASVNAAGVEGPASSIVSTTVP